MPYALPKHRTEQAAYNRRLQSQFAATRRAPLSGELHDPQADLRALDELHASGALTDEEFAAEKERVLAPSAVRAELLVAVLRAAVDGDLSDLHDRFTDNVTAWTPALRASSRDELFEQYARRDDAMSDVELDAEPLQVGGDFACAEWTVTMTHTGALALPDGTAVEPTGERVTLHGATVAEFDDGRICALRQYWDEMSLFEQLGLVTRAD
jgi:ketosteroid isomerase-like protein